jgi:fatty-acid desaturase
VGCTLYGLGNTVGYHRLLTHRSFKASAPARWTLTLLGALHSGSPMVWVGLHRLHHTKSDGPEDPHSPRNGGFWHAHTGWLIGTRSVPLAALFAASGFGQQLAILIHDIRRLMGLNPPEWRTLCPDLEREPLMRLLDVPLVIPGLFLLQALVAWTVGGWPGLACLWAVHLAMTNLSWAVNSVCHSPRIGTAPHATREDSRNVPWLAWLTNGEGYHNNHHRYPRSAWHALGPGPDLSWLVIVLLVRLGLATDPWLPRAHRPAAENYIKGKGPSARSR